MKCQLKISSHCKKTFKKSKAAYVNTKVCCRDCYWLYTTRERTKREYEKDKRKNRLR